MEDPELARRTIWCGNLAEKVTDELLYELFLQGGPVEKITIPKDKSGKQRPFGFVVYKHEKSVPYALQLFDGTYLCNRNLTLQPRSVEFQQPQMQMSQGPLQQQEQFFDLNQMILQMGNNPMHFNNLMQQVNMMTNMNMFPGNYPSQMQQQQPFYNNYNQNDNMRHQQQSYNYQNDNHMQQQLYNHQNDNQRQQQSYNHQSNNQRQQQQSYNHQNDNQRQQSYNHQNDNRRHEQRMHPYQRSSDRNSRTDRNSDRNNQDHRSARNKQQHHSHSGSKHNRRNR